jgi:hypothetical protein
MQRRFASRAVRSALDFGVNISTVAKKVNYGLNVAGSDSAVDRRLAGFVLCVDVRSLVSDSKNKKFHQFAELATFSGLVQFVCHRP